MVSGRDVRITGEAAEHLEKVQETLSERYGINTTKVELASQAVLGLNSQRLAEELAERIKSNGKTKGGTNND